MIRALAAATSALILLGCQSVSPPEAKRAPSALAADAPELAKLGAFAVGTVEDKFALSPRVMLTAGGAVTTERNLSVRVWYPALVAVGAEPITYVHLLKLPGAAGLRLATPGVAVPGAPPLASGHFPLVVVSHGYGGWNEAMTNLTENIASKGYVVVAIDHQDYPSDAGANQQVSFGNVVLNRSRDQREIITALTQGDIAGALAYRRSIDTQKVAVIGYSMGGFGALATAGAAYDPSSGVVKLLPGPAQSAVVESAPDVARRISALITIAPWGGQPTTRAWTAKSLGEIRAPVLMIDGDNDDIVDYRGGARWIFDQLSSPRYLLVYEGARHNVANNPMPDIAGASFSALEYLTEPVWRTERLNAINAHFITAFLDLNLKGDEAKAAYLNVPTPLASEGRWTGALTAGAAASDDQPAYWRGFQRRWALGLELYSKPASPSK